MSGLNVLDRAFRDHDRNHRGGPPKGHLTLKEVSSALKDIMGSDVINDRFIKDLFAEKSLRNANLYTKVVKCNPSRGKLVNVKNSTPQQRSSQVFGDGETRIEVDLPAFYDVFELADKLLESRGLSPSSPRQVSPRTTTAWWGDEGAAGGDGSENNTSTKHNLYGEHSSEKPHFLDSTLEKTIITTGSGNVKNSLDPTQFSSVQFSSVAGGGDTRGRYEQKNDSCSPSKNEGSHFVAPQGMQVGNSYIQNLGSSAADAIQMQSGFNNDSVPFGALEMARHRGLDETKPPPGFEVRESRSKPGSKVYIDLKTGTKYGTLNKAWKIYWEQTESGIGGGGMSPTGAAGSPKQSNELKDPTESVKEGSRQNSKRSDHGDPARQSSKQQNEHRKSNRSTVGDENPVEVVDPFNVKLPPGWKVIESQSIPGTYVFMDEKTKTRFGSPHQAWKLHNAREEEPNKREEEAKRRATFAGGEIAMGNAHAPGSTTLPEPTPAQPTAPLRLAKSMVVTTGGSDVSEAWATKPDASKLPPGFYEGDSRSKPGAKVYIDSETKLKYGSPQKAWKVYWEKIGKPRPKSGHAGSASIAKYGPQSTASTAFGPQTTAPPNATPEETDLKVEEIRREEARRQESDQRKRREAEHAQERTAAERKAQPERQETEQTAEAETKQRAEERAQSGAEQESAHELEAQRIAEAEHREALEKAENDRIIAERNAAAATAKAEADSRLREGQFRKEQEILAKDRQEAAEANARAEAEKLEIERQKLELEREKLELERQRMLAMEDQQRLQREKVTFSGSKDRSGSKENKGTGIGPHSKDTNKTVHSDKYTTVPVSAKKPETASRYYRAQSQYTVSDTQNRSDSKDSAEGKAVNRNSAPSGCAVFVAGESHDTTVAQTKHEQKVREREQEEKERQEKDRQDMLQREKEKKEREHVIIDKRESERKERERKERQRREDERRQREHKERDRIEEERRRADRTEWESEESLDRLERERKDRIERETRERERRERLDRERAEHDKRDAERREHDKRDAERRDAERREMESHREQIEQDQRRHEEFLAQRRAHQAAQMQKHQQSITSVMHSNVLGPDQLISSMENMAHTKDGHVNSALGSKEDSARESNLHSGILPSEFAENMKTLQRENDLLQSESKALRERLELYQDRYNKLEDDNHVLRLRVEHLEIQLEGQNHDLKYAREQLSRLSSLANAQEIIIRASSLKNYGPDVGGLMMPSLMGSAEAGVAAGHTGFFSAAHHVKPSGRTVGHGHIDNHHLQHSGSNSALSPNFTGPNMHYHLSSPSSLPAFTGMANPPTGTAARRSGSPLQIDSLPQRPNDSKRQGVSPSQNRKLKNSQGGGGGNYGTHGGDQAGAHQNPMSMTYPQSPTGGTRYRSVSPAQTIYSNPSRAASYAPGAGQEHAGQGPYFMLDQQTGMHAAGDFSFKDYTYSGRQVGQPMTSGQPHRAIYGPPGNGITPFADLTHPGSDGSSPRSPNTRLIKPKARASQRGTGKRFSYPIPDYSHVASSNYSKPPRILGMHGKSGGGGKQKSGRKSRHHQADPDSGYSPNFTLANDLGSNVFGPNLLAIPNIAKPQMTVVQSERPKNSPRNDRSHSPMRTFDGTPNLGYSSADVQPDWNRSRSTSREARKRVPGSNREETPRQKKLTPAEQKMLHQRAVNEGRESPIPVRYIPTKEEAYAGRLEGMHKKDWLQGEERKRAEKLAHQQYVMSPNNTQQRSPMVQHGMSPHNMQQRTPIMPHGVSLQMHPGMSPQMMPQQGMSPQMLMQQQMQQAGDPGYRQTQHDPNQLSTSGLAVDHDGLPIYNCQHQQNQNVENQQHNPVPQHGPAEGNQREEQQGDQTSGTNPPNQKANVEGKHNQSTMEDWGRSIPGKVFCQQSRQKQDIPSRPNSPCKIERPNSPTCKVEGSSSYCQNERPGIPVHRPEGSHRKKESPTKFTPYDGPASPCEIERPNSPSKIDHSKGEQQRPNSFSKMEQQRPKNPVHRPNSPYRPASPYARSGSPLTKRDLLLEKPSSPFRNPGSPSRKPNPGDAQTIDLSPRFNNSNGASGLSMDGNCSIDRAQIDQAQMSQQLLNAFGSNLTGSNLRTNHRASNDSFAGNLRGSNGSCAPALATDNSSGSILNQAIPHSDLPLNKLTAARIAAAKNCTESKEVYPPESRNPSPKIDREEVCSPTSQEEREILLNVFDECSSDGVCLTERTLHAAMCLIMVGENPDSNAINSTTLTPQLVSKVFEHLDRGNGEHSNGGKGHITKSEFLNFFQVMDEMLR